MPGKKPEKPASSTPSWAPNETKINDLIKQAVKERAAGNQAGYQQLMGEANAEQDKDISIPDTGGSGLTGWIHKLDAYGNYSNDYFNNSFSPSRIIGSGSPDYSERFAPTASPAKPTTTKTNTGTSTGTGTTAAQPISPWEQQMNNLMNQYGNMINSINYQFGPQQNAANDQATANIASTALGGVGGDTAGLNAYLQQHMSNAAATGQGVTNAQQEEMNAGNVAALNTGMALKDMGAAETAQMAAAPYSTLINGLLADIPYLVSRNLAPGLTQQYPTNLQHFINILNGTDTTSAASLTDPNMGSFLPSTGTSTNAATPTPPGNPSNPAGG